MNRKQRDNANRKYAAGLSKKLLHTEWGEVLDESLHHILKNHKVVSDPFKTPSEGKM